ncbi:tetratricopeptide repeat protein [Paracraurococcus lichenis]|uniref:Tetratricopeptide repeat protein n=1 Tax=Paracraurococcus lichenis TaxID=3064888 RepID=A0ABT9DXF3_9PROT|nr:hypothetical protein [Paracraurococcus sp. LOR1-02]MDO9708579.1 hypothetical protein [Paracraurococcus sp. LOR1-02]
MRRNAIVAGTAALLLSASAARAHDEHAGHHMVGQVAFANSCAPAAQEPLLQGVAMLHSFWYGAGEQSFREALAKDPGCGVATWGIAALLMQNPLAGIGPSPAEAARAQEAIALGRRIGAGTPRERDYIEAVAAYYEDWAARPERQRQESRAKAFEALAARYPDDDEAQIFSALYIAGTQSQADQSYAAYARAAAILEPQFARHPDHPGVAHYLIHVYDAPPLAAQGLQAARRYAAIAPDAPHALHMPSHIFTRVGAWPESAATNQRSFEVAVRAGDRAEAYHASDYAVYADLQMARDEAARAAIAAVFQVQVTGASPPAWAYAAAAMPSRYALERGDWRGAMALGPAPGTLPYAQAQRSFARGLGAARAGEVEAAGRAAAELAQQRTALVEAGNAYWAREVEVQQHVLAAWIAQAEGRTAPAIAEMRQAADLEDRSEKHIVTPGRMLPARELLGDMLVAAGRPADALTEYERSQQREPNRFRGLSGAAQAAEAAGDRDKAALYYGRLLTLAAEGQDRPELARARAFLAR